jgi:neutral ceramidase
MFAGTAKVDITPTGHVWMDGMIRAQPSQGVHDPLFARALVMSNTRDLHDAVAVVSVDVCALPGKDAKAAQELAGRQTGIPVERIIIAATHTHSGPATFGFFNPAESAYTGLLMEHIAEATREAAEHLRPVTTGCAAGSENTISHYRRLLADDGHVVMNWEPFPAERIVRVLGVVDPEVGVLRFTAADHPGETLCLLFNHAGHPNVLSGENYLLSAEYPGLAERLLEEQFGGTAIFLNGAQGTMDIDGLRDRDWEGMDRIGKALAQAVADTAATIMPVENAGLRAATVIYSVPARKITKDEWKWAQAILTKTGGTVQALADGVGDDYRAVLYRDLRAVQDQPIPVAQTCFAVSDCVFLSFPGELYTEIGMQLKAASPFPHTYIIGLANGYIGYIPTRQAIGEGGYAEDTRRVDAAAAEIIAEQSLALIREVYQLTNQ